MNVHEKKEITIFIENNTTQTFFNKNSEGNYIGYHCEGGETFDEVEEIPLSMKTLRNDKPLFLSYNPTHWFPGHLPDSGKYRIYEVIFRPIDLVRFKLWDQFHNLLNRDKKNEVYSESAILEFFKQAGFKLFVVGENDKYEIPEAVLFEPVKSVISITEISDQLKECIAADSDITQDALTIVENSRGFTRVVFKDLYNNKCSIKQSSLANLDAIWFGVDDPDPVIPESHARALGIATKAINGWVPYSIPKEVIINTRMHLSREQIAMLLPTLQHFVITGELI